MGLGSHTDSLCVLWEVVVRAFCYPVVWRWYPLCGAPLPDHSPLDNITATGRLQQGRTPAYELSATNVDKPPLPPATLRSRVEVILATPPPHPLPPAVVLVTAAPLFEQKARLLPGTTFVIGVDTAVRLVDAAYYGGSEAAMVASLAAIAGRGCDFLVAARVDARTGRLATLADVAVPGGASGPFGRLFEAVPTAAFRADVSSTQIRKQGGGGQGEGAAATAATEACPRIGHAIVQTPLAPWALLRDQPWSMGIPAANRRLDHMGNKSGAHRHTKATRSNHLGSTHPLPPLPRKKKKTR